jgi:hypothetical protein
MKRVLCLTAFVLIAAAAAFGDIARPDSTPNRTPKPKPVDASMTIRMDKDVKTATLRIPRSQLRQLSAELEQMADENNTASTTGGISRTQTVVSGMLLSLAMAFGGMWFVRSGKASSTGKTLVVFALVAGIGSAATIAYANAGPPASLRTISSSLFDKKEFGYWNEAFGKIKIEVTDGSVLELRVPIQKEWTEKKSEE